MGQSGECSGRGTQDSKVENDKSEKVFHELCGNKYIKTSGIHSLAKVP